MSSGNRHCSIVVKKQARKCEPVHSQMLAQMLGKPLNGSAIKSTVPAAVPVVVVMPTHLQSLLRTILNRCGGTGAAQRHGLSPLGGSSQNEQCANGGKPQNFRHLHLILLGSMDVTSATNRPNESASSPRRRSWTEVRDVNVK
jgi:hypothetical protein